MEKDVANDYAAAMEMIRRSGQQGVPVIATDDEVILGFDQVRLARLAEKRSGPKRPPLGLLGADAEQYLGRHPEAANGASVKTGVYVGEIRTGTVAEHAGLQRGDIITSLAGKRVKTIADMDRMVGTLKAGEAVSVRFWRGGEEQTGTLQF